MEADGSGAVDAQSAPHIDIQVCSGCGRCVAACLEKLISLETVRFHKNATMQRHDRCATCDRCITACPVAALHR